VRFATKKWILVLLTSVLATGTAACGTGATESGSSTTPDDGLRGLTRPDPLTVGSLSLPDETVGGPGGEFAFRAASDELLIVYFGFTSCPDVCPTTMADLRMAQEMLGPDAGRVDLAMVTVDPERDTAEILTGYLGSFADRYHALRTTDVDRLQVVEEAFGASSAIETTPEGKVEVAHSATTYVVGVNGTVLVEWPFGTSPADMAHDLRRLLEAGKT
jgi:protein SCO1